MKFRIQIGQVLADRIGSFRDIAVRNRSRLSLGNIICFSFIGNIIFDVGNAGIQSGICGFTGSFFGIDILLKSFVTVIYIILHSRNTGIKALKILANCIGYFYSSSIFGNGSFRFGYIITKGSSIGFSIQFRLSCVSTCNICSFCIIVQCRSISLGIQLCLGCIRACHICRFCIIRKCRSIRFTCLKCCNIGLVGFSLGDGIRDISCIICSTGDNGLFCRGRILHCGCCQIRIRYSAGGEEG